MIKQIIKSIIVCIFISSCSVSGLSVSELSTPTPIPTIVNVETMIANPDYLADCRLTYSVALIEQVDYKKIYPGKSTQADLIEIFGEPTEIIQVIPSEIEWIYDSDAIILENKMVVGIYVFEGLQILSNYLKSYGCPEIIFAVDGDQHPSGRYKNLFFAYPKIGFGIAFNKFPIRIIDIPIQVQYFAPQTLDEFFNERYYFLNSIYAKPVFWHEVLE